MILSDISVKRPVLATVLSLLLVAFGILAFFSLPLRELPDIDPPVVSIETTYRGASARVVETRVTKVIEAGIAGIEGIKTIDATSEDGRSNITIQFSLARNIDGAANDVRDAVGRVRQNLPEEADESQIAKVDADSDPIMWFNLTSDTLDPLALTDYAHRYLVDRLSDVEGVARVRVNGQGRYAMRIWLDRKAMAARALTVADVEAALRRENVELPAGRIESSKRDFNVRVARAYATPEDFARLPIGQGQDGHIIRLGEVASVEVGSDVEHSYFRRNGVPQVGIGIVKQSTANTLDVAHAVKDEVAKINASLPEGIAMHVSYDSSVFIDEAVHEVYLTLLISIVLVLIVIYLFLGTLRAALIPAVTVPVCIIGSFIALAAFGVSLNLITLLAFVLAIGLVVDDAIVVLENIQRRIDQGEPPLMAAYRGARQVGFAVVATTAVLVSVFVPLMFIGGDVGRMFGELAIAIASAVVFSAFVALSLSPAMCSKLLKPSAERNAFARRVDTLFNELRVGYQEWLDRAIKRPVAILAIVAGSLAAIVVLWSSLKSELAPEEDRGFFLLFVNAPEGASFDYTVRQMKEVEKIVLEYVDKGEIYRVLTRVPGAWGNVPDMSTGRAMVALVPWSERQRDTKTISGELGRRLAEMPGVRVLVIIPQGLTRQGGRPVQFVIGGADYAELARWRDLMLAKIAQNPRLIAPDADFKETKPQLRVQIDRTRASDLGVSIETIGRTLETMLGSRKVTTYIDKGEEYDVVLRVRDEDRRQPSDLTNIYVRSERTGALIALSNVVSLTEVGDAGKLSRFNRQSAITISASLAPGYTLGEALTFMEKTARDTLPATARFDYRGESRTFKESGASILFVFGLALVVVFLVLAAQFESFVHPSVIMLSVPLAIAGGLLGLVLFGQTLNIYSQIGIVILIGIAAKNGILIVEFANQLRDQGKSFDDALKEASQTRLRPIIMTSLSTAIGALPLILATGAGAASRMAIGVVIVFGVLVATVLTLFVVPVMYKLIARGTRSPEAVARELDALEARNQGRFAPGE